MLPAKKGQLAWQEALKFINKCPACGAVYATEQARLFAQRNKVNLVHISCVECRGNFIAMILVMSQGISTIGMVSDLNYEDARRVHHLEPFNIDELIDGRELINQGNLYI